MRRKATDRSRSTGPGSGGRACRAVRPATPTGGPARRCRRSRSGSFGKLRTARVGSVGTQRLGLPLALVRADAADPSVTAHERALVRAAVQAAADDDVLVLDAGFAIRQLQEAR